MESEYGMGSSLPAPTSLCGGRSDSTALSLVTQEGPLALCVPANALGKSFPQFNLGGWAPRPSPNTETVVLGATWKPTLRWSQGRGQAAALLQTAETRDSVSPMGSRCWRLEKQVK